MIDALTLEFNRALRKPDVTHDRLERRGFAGCVCPEERDHLARLYLDRNALEHSDAAVAAVDIP
jgi:hypothetical protein